MSSANKLTPAAVGFPNLRGGGGWVTRPGSHREDERCQRKMGGGVLAQLALICCNNGTGVVGEDFLLDVRDFAAQEAGGGGRGGLHASPHSHGAAESSPAC